MKMAVPKNRRIEVSADAANRVQFARDWIQSYPSDTEMLVLAHSVEAATDLYLGVISASGAWFGVKRLTLNGLASRLAQHARADSGTAPASNLSFTAVRARAIHSLHSDGKLKYFAPVATRPGFPIAVAKTLEEIRMNEVEPESLARLTRGGKDLAAIADLVDQELTQARLSDRAVLFRAAIDSIAALENAGYVGRPLLLLDVAVQGKLEKMLIQELAGRSPDVLATAPSGDGRTILALEEALHCERNDGDEAATNEGAVNLTKENKAVTSPRTSNSLSYVKQHLFENSAPAVTPLDSSVKLQNWPREPPECVEIIRTYQCEAV